MPYFWESLLWRGRLLAMSINHPDPSGLYALFPYMKTKLLPRSDVNINPNRHLPYVRKDFRKLAINACNEERNNKLVQVNSMMSQVNGMIQQRKKGQGQDWGGVTLSDLQGLWYVLRYFIFSHTVDTTTPKHAVQHFTQEYWSTMLPALECHLGNKLHERSVLEQLILCRGIGTIDPARFFPECRIQSPHRQIMTDLDKFFHVVDKQMQGHNELYAMSKSLVGSVAEGSKIGICDEFDYRLEFDRIHIQSEITENCTGLVHIQDACDSFHPSLHDIHPLFMKSVKSMRGLEVTPRMKLLECDDLSVPVPWILFQWTPDLSRPDDWALIKVDCALTIPCPGLWPDDKTLDPLGQPIRSGAHLMLPNPSGFRSSNKKWRWSVCEATQQVFQSLPKHALLGYIISKIVCNSALFPEQCKPPDSFCLKTCLLNALANKDIVLAEDKTKPSELLLQAIQVADVILAGLSKAQFGYFYIGEPVELLRPYLTNRDFMAQHSLCILVEDHLKHTANKIPLHHLVPKTSKIVNDTPELYDLDLLRDMLGLLRVKDKEKDSWGKIAQEAARRWTHEVAGGMWCMCLDASLLEYDLHKASGAEDLEAIRSKVAKHDLAHLNKESEHDFKQYIEEARSMSTAFNHGLHTAPPSCDGDYVVCSSEEYGQHAVYKSLGEVYEACLTGLDRIYK